MEIQVKGHSGCNIEIIDEGERLCVCKSSTDPLYLDRLILQADKQKRAAEKRYSHIKIPRIFAIKRTLDYAFIKMEYIYSKNFIQYFEEAGFEQIDSIINALIDYVEREISESSVQLVPPQKMLEKFNDVKQHINSNIFLTNDEEIQNLIILSEKYFNSLCDIKLPIGVCHGDLTFSNILFNGSTCYLIDFLDSFVESPLQDIVKIRQDSAYLWSQLMYTKPYDKTRLEIIFSVIDNEINNHFKKYDWYNNHYKVFQLMNMLRVLQYSNNTYVVNFLKKTIKDICHEF